MPKFASLSQDATNRLREKTGNASLECYIYIDAEHEEDSFALVRYTERVVQVSFGEMTYNPSSFVSLVDGVYKAIYE